SVGSDPNRSGFRVSGLTLPSRLTVGRLEKRRELLKDVDEWQRQVENEPQFDVLDNFYKRSYEMITAPAVKKAFEIDKEPDELRERYGRNTFGQSCLLARRLVESGVSFVHIERGGWDNHGKIFAALSENRLPELDRGFSALLDDLSKRGLLDSTIVVWMGEFGRTPKVDWSD
ncbi:MAG: DUF1501 domain-containing protein, partial [Verrucomicrobiota bacterium]|nr:DUF1501 domain-containing protein [Verrucomicrobiota bacterium]